MSDFGLVTEGITDQAVISNILYGYFENPDLVITELQPLRDETDRNRTAGGWGNLIEYCQSSVFQQAFQTTKYVIVQIDTDVCEEYGVPKNENGNELTPEQLVEKVRLKFVELIGEDFYGKVAQRVIFAISVHSIECWLLPIFYDNNKKSKLTNCLGTLNEALKKKYKFTIHEKKLEYYEEISDVFAKKKHLKKHYPNNPSFAIFIKTLDEFNMIFEN